MYFHSETMLLMVVKGEYANFGIINHSICNSDRVCVKLGFMEY